MASRHPHQNRACVWSALAPGRAFPPILCFLSVTNRSSRNSLVFTSIQNPRGGAPPMKACVLHSPSHIETNPLVFEDYPMPQPGAGEVLIRVAYCGVCRTDLHVIERELIPQKSPVIPGHQVIGSIEKFGADASRFPVGARVGVA